MEMHQIRYFITLSEERNFRRAAEKCCVAQPSMTKAIKLLEAELGGALFNRAHSGIDLTELGRIISPYLQRVFAESMAAKTIAKNYSSNEDAPLKLGVMCTIAPKRFVALISGMQTHFPGVKIELIDGDAIFLNEALRGGRVDAAIMTPVGSCPDQKLHCMPLFREAMTVVVGLQHKFAKSTSISLGDLDHEAYISRLNCEFNYTRNSELLQHMALWRPIFRSQRDDWVLDMVSSGLGFGFVPESCAAYPGVKIYNLADQNITRMIQLITIRGRQHPPALGALLRQVRRIDWETGQELNGSCSQKNPDNSEESIAAGK